jgi:hypothetical protein
MVCLFVTSIAASPPPGKSQIRRAIASSPASPHDFAGMEFSGQG